MKNLKLSLNESNKIEDVFDEDSLRQALYAWKYLETQKEINTGIVLKTHKILMLHQDLMPNERGYFRRVPVWIGGKEAPNFTNIPNAMAQWVDVVNANVQAKIPSWKTQHIMFEKIHPFVDGNGRIGRIFMNWQRVKVGLPIKVIEASKRDKYYRWFK